MSNASAQKTHGRYAWYELVTTDAAAAKTFYGDVVGWRMQESPMPGMTYTLLMTGDTQVGGLMPMPKAACDAGAKPGWVGYISVDDVDAAATKVQSLGGVLHQAPMDIPGVGRFAMVADPQGATFNLFKSLQPGGASAPDAPGHIGWHELHTSDWPKAYGFYGAMFDWQKGDAIDMGGIGTYQLFNITDAVGGAMFNSPAAQQMPYWQYYFSVGDIDAAVKRVTAGGGRIMHGPQEVPGGAWVVQGADPQGALFALHGTRAN